MSDIGMLFAAISAAKNVAQLVGLLDSLDAKIDRLGGSFLDGGIRALDQALVASEERNALLREARSKLNQAFSVEVGNPERTTACYISLAVVHHVLGDAENVDRTLLEFARAKFSSSVAKQSKALFLDAVFAVFSPIHTTVPVHPWSWRLAASAAKVADLQEQALRLVQERRAGPGATDRTHE